MKKQGYQGLSMELLALETRSAILIGSLGAKLAITAVGQETETVDFQDADYQLEWGTNFE